MLWCRYYRLTANASSSSSSGVDVSLSRELEAARAALAFKAVAVCWREQESAVMRLSVTQQVCARDMGCTCLPACMQPHQALANSNSPAVAIMHSRAEEHILPAGAGLPASHQQQSCSSHQALVSVAGSDGLCSDVMFWSAAGARLPVPRCALVRDRGHDSSLCRCAAVECRGLS